MEGVGLMVLFLFLAMLGVPLAYAMGVSTLAALVLLDVPITVFFTRSLAGIDAFALLAIPLFVFVGELLTGGGMSQRIIDFANSMVGWMRGGLGVVNVGGSVLFAGVSGSSAADTAAVGGVMIPAMKRSGYDAAFAAAVTASSSTIGSLIPPSVLLIIYGGITGLSIGSLFLAGVLPGLLVGLLLGLITWWSGRRQVDREMAFSIRNVLTTGRRSILAGLLPVVVVLGIVFGLFTATEGGIVAAVYALLVGSVIYRELSVRDVARMAVRTVELTGVLLLLLAMATAFAWVLAAVGLPRQVLLVLTSWSDNRAVILLIVVAALLVFGMFVETIAAATIVVPILLPLGASLGYDPLHFGMVVIMTLLVGTVTPPVGILLYICAGLAEVSIGQAVKAIAPFLAVLAVCVVIVAYVPALSLWLPSLAQ